MLFHKRAEIFRYVFIKVLTEIGKEAIIIHGSRGSL
jgi:hypothetical protein